MWASLRGFTDSWHLIIVFILERNLSSESQSRGNAHLPRQTLLRLALVCCGVGLFLYAVGWAEYLWLSLIISLGIGFTTRYSKIWMQKIRPDMPLPLVYTVAVLFAVAIWGLIPVLVRYRWLLDSAAGQVDSAVSLLNYLPALLMGTAATLVLSYIYFSREQAFDLQQALDRAEIHRINKEKEVLETRLRLLQSQIEPHFLFNTLANIQALIALEPKQANKMLSALTALLRQSLNRTRQEWLTLGDELRFNQAYLAIQQIRLGDRLRVSLDIADNVPDNLWFPPMLLQPLIENAIVHGIEPLRQGGELRLSVQIVEQRLLINIYNDGSPSVATSAHQGHSVGLATTRERVLQIYGDTAVFSFADQGTAGVLVKIEVPIYVASHPTRVSSIDRG
jgi:sensor histidine kinase YesM